MERAVTSEQNHSSFTLPQYSSPTDQSHENSESTTNNDNSAEEEEGEAAPPSWNETMLSEIRSVTSELETSLPVETFDLE
jgi:hypothetical protein